MNLDRQSFLGQESGLVISEARATVVGLCGGGSHAAQQLAHIGVGTIRLVDFDRVDDTNLNRMVGLTAQDVAKQKLKTEVIERLVKGINPDAKVEVYPSKWQDCERSLRDSTVIFGCVDSFMQRDELERFSRRFMVPYIDIGMDVSGDEGKFVIAGQIILSLPGYSCMRCMGFLNENVLAKEANNYGATGGKPQVVWPNGVLASVAVMQFMNLITPWQNNDHPALYLDYDGNRSTVTPNNRLHCIKTESCKHFQGGVALGEVSW